MDENKKFKIWTLILVGPYPMRVSWKPQEPAGIRRQKLSAKSIQRKMNSIYFPKMWNFGMYVPFFDEGRKSCTGIKHNYTDKQYLFIISDNKNLHQINTWYMNENEQSSYISHFCLHKHCYTNFTFSTTKYYMYDDIQRMDKNLSDQYTCQYKKKIVLEDQPLVCLISS